MKLYKLFVLNVCMFPSSLLKTCYCEILQLQQVLMWAGMQFCVRLFTVPEWLLHTGSSHKLPVFSSAPDCETFNLSLTPGRWVSLCYSLFHSYVLNHDWIKILWCITLYWIIAFVLRCVVPWSTFFPLFFSNFTTNDSFS